MILTFCWRSRRRSPAFTCRCLATNRQTLPDTQIWIFSQIIPRAQVTYRHSIFLSYPGKGLSFTNLMINRCSGSQPCRLNGKPSCIQLLIMRKNCILRLDKSIDLLRWQNERIRPDITRYDVATILICNTSDICCKWTRRVTCTVSVNKGRRVSTGQILWSP